MNTAEFLAFVRYNKLRDRSVPSLWSDETLVRYGNEGFERFAAGTDTLVQADREIALSAGEDEYPLDDDLLMVYSSWLVGYEAARMQPTTEGWTPDGTFTARPSRYTLDRASGVIRFFPTPDAAYTAVIRGARKPAKMSLDDADAECELSDETLQIVADWVAYRCFGEDDADGRNDMAAANALKRFNMGVNDAKRDNYRLRMGFGARAHGLRVK